MNRGNSMKSKYKVRISDLEQKGGVERTRHNGITNEQLHKTLYEQTDGMNHEARRKMAEKFFNTREKGR